MTAAGWYPDPGGQGQRYHDGSAWTGHLAALSDAERSDRLNQAVAYEVSRGWRVESQTLYQAVLVSGNPVNHVVHVLLAIFTCGIWLIGWIIAAALEKPIQRIVLRVDMQGNVVRG